MLNFEEARDSILREARDVGPVGVERAPLRHLSGRVLAETVVSPVDVPSSDYSAMDGYAVRAQEVVAGASLPLLGEARAGHSGAALPPAGCLRIFTGAHLPLGADAVVMQENVTLVEGGVLFREIVSPGAHIRRAGEDLKTGDTVLEVGTRLSPPCLALLAAAERVEAEVFRRPRVTVLCTGDELRAPGTQGGPGSLAESNGVALLAMAEAAGAEVSLSPLVRDQKELLTQALKRALETTDVLVTVGGVSVGDHDLVRPCLQDLGAKLIFHKVSIKPGKPVLFMRVGRTLILGLPGNPSSAQITFALFGVPLIRTLCGDSAPTPVFRTARLRNDFSHKPGRRCFYRARLSGDDAELFSHQSSGASTVMAWANALVMIDESTARLPAGASVEVLSYAELSGAW